VTADRDNSFAYRNGSARPSSDGEHVVVAVENVSKDFRVSDRPVPAIANVSLAVRAGEIVSIVGPSGCGKTTLLRMIQGLETPTSGELTIEGRKVGPGSVSSGFVFQQPALFPWFSLERNVAFGMRLRASKQRLSRADEAEKVDNLLDLVGLTGYGNYRPHQLSGGMRQRANLARALAIDPAVLLLDEPFSALDALTRERLQRALSHLLSTLRTTAVLVTHDIREAVFLGTRVVLMGPSPGRIVSEFAVDVPHPRTEDFQHGTLLAEISQEIYAALRQVDQAGTRGPASSPVTDGGPSHFSAAVSNGAGVTTERALETELSGATVDVAYARKG
jgi:ABC-type nitrate/sulfonate/bicarbonate transport system ATPase subunit